MLLLRQLTQPLTRNAQRLYAHRAIPTTVSQAMKVVQKEQLLYVSRNAKITIVSDIYMKVQSADVVQYPDGTALHSKLFGSPEKNLSADVKIKVSQNDQQVEIVCTKLREDSQCTCTLSVPIMADLHIKSKDSVSVQNMYNKELIIKAQKSIKTNDIKSAGIDLISEEGDITCTGMFLADLINLETKGGGNVLLQKAQGNMLECKTTNGAIKTNSCYVESSKFSTDNGAMDLKNVHKKSQIYVYKKGNLNLSGFHGNLYVHSNGGSMNLQLSEITGENIIMADDLEQAVVNISDSIEEHSFIEITASKISLDSPLSHLSDGLSVDNTLFHMSTERDNNNKLMICTKGPVKLGKLSWAESMKIAMGMTEK